MIWVSIYVLWSLSSSFFYYISTLYLPSYWWLWILIRMLRFSKTISLIFIHSFCHIIWLLIIIFIIWLTNRLNHIDIFQGITISIILLILIWSIAAWLSINWSVTWLDIMTLAYFSKRAQNEWIRVIFDMVIIMFIIIIIRLIIIGLELDIFIIRRWEC